MYAVETGKENKKMKKKLLILALCVLMIFTVTACAKGENTAFENTITFCLDWTPNTNHTGLYVALEKGYYREAGLTVDIVQPAESTAALMVAGGQAQFGVEAQDTMAAALIGDGALDITAVAAILQHNTSGIMSLAGSGITSPKSLENKRYSTWDSPIELAMLRYLVEKDGGDFIGTIELNGVTAFEGELGIAITAIKQNLGYGTEAVAALTRYAFEQLGLRRVWLRTHPENARAIRVYQKCGFTQFRKTDTHIFMEYLK